MAAKMPGLTQTIKLEGEAEYRARLKDISAGLRVLDSEMDKTRASFEGQEKSVEALSATQDVLSRKLSTQHERVETLRAALQQSAQTYGEADARTMSWQTQLNKAEAEELRLQHQIDDCNGALQRQSGDMEDVGEKTDEMSGKMSGLGDAIGGAASKLGVNLPQGATNALNSLGSVSAGAAAAIGGFAALAAAVVKAEKALIDMTKQAAASADELETLSLKTGLTTQSLQELQYAAEFIDVSLDTITSSLTKLTRSMDRAREGTGAAAESFAKLGISVTDESGELRRAEDVFYDAIDALGEVQNATERDALAMDLFGRSAQDLNPLIVQGSGALKDLAKEANATGYVLDDFAVKRLTAVDDAFKRLEKSRETFTKNLSAEFAPATEKAVGGLADLVDRVGAAIKNSGMVNAFSSILESVTSLLTPVGQLQDKLTPLKFVLDVIAFTCAWIADAINAIRGLSIGNWGSGLFKSAMGWDASNPSNIRKWKTYTETGYSWNSETMNWQNASGETASASGYVGRYSAKNTTEKYFDYRTAGGTESYDWWLENVYGKNVTPTWVGKNAAGTDNWRGGLTWVGENGPELLALPRGAQITSASESRELGGDTFNIYVDARNIRELNDLVRIAQNARMNARKAVS